MVKPAARAVVPHQPTREALELQKALEDGRRARAVRGVERLVTFTRAADTAASDTSDNVVHNAAKRLELGRVMFLVDAAVAANSGNFASLSLYSFDPSASSPTNTTLATLDTKQQGIAKGQARPFELKRATVPAGHALGLQVTKTLSGVQLPQGRLVVEATEGNQ